VKFREYESSFSSKGEALDFPAKALRGIMEVLSSLFQPLFDACTPIDNLCYKLLKTQLVVLILKKGLLDLVF
jgi:hypothetical protein